MPFKKMYLVRGLAQSVNSIKVCSVYGSKNYNFQKLETSFPEGKKSIEKRHFGNIFILIRAPENKDILDYDTVYLRAANTLKVFKWRLEMIIGISTHIKKFQLCLV